MRRTTARLAAPLGLAALLAVVLATGTAGPAAAYQGRAGTAQAAELSGPPVTTEKCWEGGGGPAVDRFTRVEFCSGGEYDGRVILD
ncbi:hypothetical protein CFP65_5989 [Kitasatospora sp. MMS16-BH015]|uniref:hypothetical protein n=1 Tax=Kitasatospora sp. MMS16-BH015 TaxID=2018025 RepID=UPI000CA13170|nr:hypothetical protein [Kitasatospora sp. MMS16-BH015]AUG80663.1 hypothetical protein CFP65_5989 [Kitasatospora sp. MMS16-BH015]